jgi:hypothetical protein
MKISKDIVKNLFYKITRFNFMSYGKSTQMPKVYTFYHPQMFQFSKKKEGDTKKTKTENIKKEINKEYENVSTEEIKSRYKQQADVRGGFI